MSNCVMPFEKELLSKLYKENALLIMARGLGIDRIFLNLLEMYTDPKYMIICLNLTADEQNHFLNELSHKSAQLPWLINSDIPINKRLEMYAKKGIFFITSRILTVDILTDKIPINKISGVLIYQAHRIAENCQEAFIMNLYRERNKTGFVKALSDNPIVFTKSLCRLSITMQMLFVRSVILLPRFDPKVQEFLTKNEVEVIEVHVDMTERMDQIQISLFEMISTCLSEIKKTNKYIDNDMLTLDNAIQPYFHNFIRKKLNEIWSQVDGKSRKLFTELRLLQNLVLALTQTDPISFYAMVRSIRTNQLRTGANSSWSILDSTDILFNEARKRVFGETKPTTNAEPDIQLCIDENPKLNALVDVMDEIKKTVAASSTTSQTTLIVAWEEKSCVNIKQFLKSSTVEEFVRQQYDSVCSMINSAAAEITRDKRRTVGTSTTSNLVMGKSVLDQYILNDNPVELKDVPIIFDIDEPPTVICPLTNLPDTFALSDLLYKYKPRFIVLFDTMLPFIRQIEVFKATHPDLDVTVYSMGYSDSAEELIFLSTIDIEQRAMRDLIEESKSLVVPEHVEGLIAEDDRFRRSDNRAVIGDRSELGQLESKRKRARLYEDNSANNDDEVDDEPKHRVIADMREFRSELPALLYRRGIELVPTTLEVGDYIITPDICVERKSISDLCQSLTNGRLYTQTSIMCRHYKTPILLIEFNSNVDFGIKQKFSSSANNFTSRETYSKLALLTLHFPKLRIVWCPTPTSSAEMIHELKLNRDQPDLEQAMAIRTDMTTDRGKYNEHCQDLLLRVPGVSFKNLRKLMDNVKTFRDLAKMTVDELDRIVENSNSAQLIHSFFNTKVPKQK